MKRLLSLVAAIVVGLSAGALAPAAEKMYWIEFAVDTSQLSRADVNGSNVQGLYGAGMGGPTSVAVDRAGAKVYFGVSTNSALGLYRSNLNGSGLQELIPSEVPSSVGLDFSGGKVYWTTDGEIRAANQDGSLPATLVSGLSSPRGLSVDGVGGKIYWTETSPPRLRRANLDGTGAEDLTASPFELGDTALALDLGKVYWTAHPSSGSSALHSADLDGSNEQTLPAVLGPVGGLDYDEASPALYLTELEQPDQDGRILRLNADGTGPQQVLGIAIPGAIDLDDPLPGPGSPVPALSRLGVLGAALALLLMSTALLVRRMKLPKASVRQTKA